MLKTEMDWSISADVTRGAEDFCESFRGLAEALSSLQVFLQVSVSTLVRRRINPRPNSYPLYRSWWQTIRLMLLSWDSVRDGRPPGARCGIQILGTGIGPLAWPRSVRRGAACSLSEISSCGSPTACRRSSRGFIQYRPYRAVACSDLLCFRCA